VDAETRCIHYGGPTDVVALRLACCDAFYPCHRCHAEATDHPAQVWPRARFDEPSILCGACRTTMTWPAYLASDHACPACGAAFNPGCAAHTDRYAEVDDPSLRQGEAGDGTG
jgi:uncharacterized CHY-type Zn-finger protein